jgi:hypothetical protein
LPRANIRDSVSAKIQCQRTGSERDTMKDRKLYLNTKQLQLAIVLAAFAAGHARAAEGPPVADSSGGSKLLESCNAETLDLEKGLVGPLSRMDREHPCTVSAGLKLNNFEAVGAGLCMRTYKDLFDASKIVKDSLSSAGKGVAGIKIGCEKTPAECKNLYRELLVTVKKGHKAVVDAQQPVSKLRELSEKYFKLNYLPDSGAPAQNTMAARYETYRSSIAAFLYSAPDLEAAKKAALTAPSTANPRIQVVRASDVGAANLADAYLKIAGKQFVKAEAGTATLHSPAFEELRKAQTLAKTTLKFAACKQAEQKNRVAEGQQMIAELERRASGTGAVTAGDFVQKTPSASKSTITGDTQKDQTAASLSQAKSAGREPSVGDTADQASKLLQQASGAAGQIMKATQGGQQASGGGAATSALGSLSGGNSLAAVGGGAASSASNTSAKVTSYSLASNSIGSGETSATGASSTGATGVAVTNGVSADTASLRTASVGGAGGSVATATGSTGAARASSAAFGSAAGGGSASAGGGGGSYALDSTNIAGGSAASAAYASQTSSSGSSGSSSMGSYGGGSSANGGAAIDVASAANMKALDAQFNAASNSLSAKFDLAPLPALAPLPSLDAVATASATPEATSATPLALAERIQSAAPMAIATTSEPAGQRQVQVNNIKPTSRIGGTATRAPESFSSQPFLGSDNVSLFQRVHTTHERAVRRLHPVTAAAL